MRLRQHLPLNLDPGLKRRTHDDEMRNTPGRGLKAHPSQEYKVECRNGEVQWERPNAENAEELEDPEEDVFRNAHYRACIKDQEVKVLNCCSSSSSRRKR